jgi:Amt family ammonium transporter
MTFKKQIGAGLAALAIAMLLGLFLSLPTFDGSYAQAPAATPAAPAAPAAAPAPEPPPACDAKMQINCTPNSGDTAWMLTSVALVLMMTIPGLGLFYGGMVRKKNVGTAWRSARGPRSSAGSTAPSCRAS